MLFSLWLLLIDMLNRIYVIYLSEQKRLAAKLKEDAWEGKWPIVPISRFLFCLFVCLFIFRFLDSAASLLCLCSCCFFFVFFFNWPRLSITALPRNGFPQFFSSSSSPAVTERLIVHIQHPICAPSFLCSYFVPASVPLAGQAHKRLAFMFLTF